MNNMKYYINSILMLILIYITYALIVPAGVSAADWFSVFGAAILGLVIVPYVLYKWVLYVVKVKKDKEAKK